MEEKIELSREALADLASQAAQEVSGVACCLQNSVDTLTSRIKREFLHHGVKVEEEDGAYRFEIHIAVYFGDSIPRIAAGDAVTGQGIRGGYSRRGGRRGRGDRRGHRAPRRKAPDPGA